MEHNCVRNPATGACYVCNTPMRLNFHSSPLDAIIDRTQHPREMPTNIAHTCGCGKVIPASETQCLDCWIAEQTKAKETIAKLSNGRYANERYRKENSQPLTVSLDAILDAMENDRSKWN